MKKKIFTLRVTALLLALCMLVCNDGYCNGYAVMAAEGKADKNSSVKKFGFAKQSVTLYVGNIYELETVNVKPDDVYIPYFYSSDSDIVRVDENGKLRAVGVGKADITAYYGEDEAVCHINVKPCHSVVDQPKITLYEGQKTTVKLTDSKQKAVKYNYFICNAKTGYEESESYSLEVQSEGKGVFTVEGKCAGRYYLDLALTNKKGSSFSARCEVEVLKCGFDSDEVVVAKGGTIKLEPMNAKIVSCGFGYYEYDEDDVRKSKVKVSEDGEITGIEELNVDEDGYIALDVKYIVPSGEEKSEVLWLYVTDPKYIPFEGKLFAGESYELQFEGLSSYSKIKVSSSNGELMDIYEWSFIPSIWPKEAGKTVLEIIVDGRKFSQEVEVIAPKLNVGEYAFVKKGKSKAFTFTGLPEDCKVKWSTSDKKVATVSSKGKVTGKTAGSALITAAVDGKTFRIPVTVVNNNEYKVVTQAMKTVGAEYSQEKRMKEGFYDCSSLVWRSYNDAGIKICNLTYAPTAAELAKALEKAGKAISYGYLKPEKLKPGDLIFYGGNPSYNDRYKGIYHVSMYLGAYYGWNGDINMGMCIDATPSAGGVTTYRYSYGEFDDGEYSGIVMIARPLK